MSIFAQFDLFRCEPLCAQLLHNLARQDITTLGHPDLRARREPDGVTGTLNRVECGNEALDPVLARAIKGTFRH